MATMQQADSNPLTRRAVLLVLALIVGLLIGMIARTVWIYRDYPFDADEAIHANGALAMALDLRAGDLQAFARTVYRQGFYPPAFSVLKAIAFLIFGASPLVARAFSLFCLPAGLLMIYLTGRSLDDSWGWLIGAIGVALTLTSQFLLVTSALVMMEVPGLLASFGMLWLYIKALKKPTAGRLIGTSLMLAVTFLTKYTYGVGAVATVVLMEASRLLLGRGDSRARALRVRDTWMRWVWLLGPFLVVMIIWFARPYKIADFWSYATAQPAHRSWSLESLLFYPRSIALHHSPSPLFAIITLVSLLWALGRWRSAKHRLLLIYFCVGLGEMTLNSPNSPRFICTFVPAIHLLTGAMIVWCLRRRSEASLSRWWRLVAVLLVVSLVAAVPVLFERYRTYPSLMEVAYETHPKLDELAGWIQNRIPSGGRFYVINFWDQMSPWALSWYFGTHKVPPQARFSDLSMPSALLEEASTENISSLREEILASDVRYLVAFEGAPWGEPVWWIYVADMGDILQVVDRTTMYVDLYDTGGWLKHSLLRKGAWERVKTDGRFTLQVTTTVYNVSSP